MTQRGELPPDATVAEVVVGSLGVAEAKREQDVMVANAEKVRVRGIEADFAVRELEARRQSLREQIDQPAGR